MTDTLEAEAEVELPAASGPILRSFAIDDLVVRAGGDGRTVEAYAAVFGKPAEIRDQYGHYYEQIDRSAFDAALKRGQVPKVMMNHGRDIYGRPSDRFALPVGVHIEATPDARGLRTVSRMVETPAGDEALELMRSGAIDGFSFQGKPNRSRKIAAARDGDLPTIVRQELSLAEYGPAIFRAYEDARVMALRSEQLADELGELSAEQFTELLTVLRSRFPDLADSGRSDETPDADNAASHTSAADEFNHQRRLMAARLRGLI